MSNFGEKRIGNMILISKVDFDRLIWQLEAKDSQIKVRGQEIKRLRNELANKEITDAVKTKNDFNEYLLDIDDLDF